jgi:trk system potassium uptake protein TrkA
MKEFAVIGLGNFGAMVARKLAEFKCKVTAIDIDKAKVQSLQQVVHLAILADATDIKVLENIDAKNFDCFIISTGDNSHASILITLHLKELGVKNIIVKANSDDHSKILYKVGASMTIIPEEEMAVKIARSLAQPNIIDYLPLSGDYSIAEVKTPAKFVGKSLMDLKLRTEYQVEVIAIKDSRTDKFTFIPGAAYKLREAEILILIGKNINIKRLQG